MALEHRVRFSNLHEKRALVIADLDRQAYEIEVNSLKYASNVGEGGVEQYAKTMQLVEDFNAFYESNRIYLSEEMEGSLFGFIQTVREPLVAIKVWGESNARKESDHSKVKIFEAFEAATDNIPKMRTKLIKEFRTILEGK